MHLVLRSLAGESAEVELEGSATISELKGAVEQAMGIPVLEQRLVYAGAPLEEVVTAAWRQRKRDRAGDIDQALGTATLPDGTPLTLEHYAMQKGSVINIARRGSAPANVAATDGGYLAPGALGTVPIGTVPEQPAGLPVSTAPGAQVARPPNVAWMPPQRLGGEPPPNALLPPGAGPPPTDPLIAQLDHMPDLDLHLVLAPLLQRRPAVRASLLAEQPQGGEFMYNRGESVSVWSNSQQRWVDGRVTGLTHEVIPRGSVEVTFDESKKWVAPADMSRVLRRRHP